MKTLEDALAECRLVAILRGVKPAEAVAIGEALFVAGVRAVEVPLNSPDPLQSISALARAFEGRMLVGGGTVLRPTDVEAVAAAGGRLIVSPDTNLTVIDRAVSMGLEAAPGFATASEAFAAVGAGARALKLFPASTYGPAHLKALKAVLPPQVTVLAVGGVGPAAFESWRSAGANGFGLGSELYRAGDTADIVGARARQCVAALRAA
jgi:2-dehydro-3-deoxyphosphogalactonate aldolase